MPTWRRIVKGDDGVEWLTDFLTSQWVWALSALAVGFSIGRLLSARGQDDGRESERSVPIDADQGALHESQADDASVDALRRELNALNRALREGADEEADEETSFTDRIEAAESAVISVNQKLKDVARALKQRK